MRKLVLLCFTFVLASTGFATTAYAGGSDLGSTQIIETSDSRKACVDPLIENPFTQFGDNLDYVLAPDGNFDGNVTGWQVAGGAQIVDTDKGRSLQIPEDGVAISPSMCVDLHFPTFRMYHRTVKSGTLAAGKSDKSEIKVEVIYLDKADKKWKEMKKFHGKDGDAAPSGWMVSDSIDLKPELGGKAPGARQAALRFTIEHAEKGESVLLDDVYVDPMRR
jgi:hypothetical protein